MYRFPVRMLVKCDGACPPCTLATTQVFFFFASLLNERSTVIQINLLLEQTIHDSEFECIVIQSY